MRTKFKIAANNENFNFAKILSGAKYLLSNCSASEKWAKFGEICEFRMAFI